MDPNEVAHFASKRPVSLGCGLRDATHWLGSRATETLRSSVLLSSERGGVTPEVDYPKEIDDVVSARRALLGSVDSHSRCPGELLLWAPEWDNFDGHLEAESGGFFDVNDSPPWECWVGWFAHQLSPDEWFGLAWIPAQFVDVINHALEVEITEVVKWAASLRSSSELSEPFRNLALPPDVACDWD